LLQHGDIGFESHKEHVSIYACISTVFVLPCVGRGLATAHVNPKGSHRLSVRFITSILKWEQARRPNQSKGEEEEEEEEGERVERLRKA
jgi:hypothetical protein